MTRRMIFLIVWLGVTLMAAEYTCPMHPHILSEHEGSCPICGMDLVPVAPSQTLTEGNRSVVTIAPETVQAMGVVTEAVTTTTFGRKIRAFGTVVRNERTVRRISVRTAGWIERLHVNAPGDPVTPGTLLFRLYAPELIQAQRDFLGAGARGEGRLLALGMAKRSILQLGRSKTVEQNVPFYAESGGVITDLAVRQGEYVTPGRTLLEIADFASVWVHAFVSEQDAVYIDEWSTVQIVQRELGNVTYEAEVDYLYPQMDPRTHSVIVRMVLDNPRGLLRPGNAVDVTFTGDFDERLSVPADALLRHSDGTYVVIALGAGRFVPRKILTGFRSDGRVAVVRGLNAGERVVTSGQFLLDSESALRDALNNMRRTHDHADH